MIRKEPGRVVVITPKGIVYAARALFEYLEARLPPDELFLLRDFGWWLQLGELLTGIQLIAPDQEQEAQP